MRLLSRFSALSSILLIMGALTVGTAQASPLDDITNCRVLVGPTSLSNYQVTGAGGSTGCAADPAFVGVEVCVDYNVVTQPLSCRLIPKNQSGVSIPVPCVPGTWMTQATPMGVFGPLGSSIHSLPPQVYTLNCLNPA